MKLSNLIKNKIQIDELDHDKFITEFETYINSLLNVLGTCEADYTEYIQQLNKELLNAKNIINNTQTITDNIYNKIKEEVEAKTKNWDKAGYTVGDKQFSTSVIYELEKENRISIPSDAVKQKVLAVVQTFSDPRYACLEIGPGDGEWTPHLVASDPLYLVDIHQEFLDSTIFKFPEQYRRRLRPYLLDFNNQYSLDKLPQNQFGFVFSWNVFDYFPREEMKIYLESCFKVLRPGGRMLFSYNNCDTVNGANYADIGNKSWMTEERVLTICKELGFEIEINNVNAESWVCIKKPGILKTVKTHQALGEIKNHSA